MLVKGVLKSIALLIFSLAVLKLDSFAQIDLNIIPSLDSSKVNEKGVYENKERLPVRGYGSSNQSQGSIYPYASNESGRLITVFEPIQISSGAGDARNPKLAADDQYVYCVWERVDNNEIYWVKTDYNGNVVADEINVSNTGGYSTRPAIGLDDSGYSYVVWQEGSGWGDVYFSRIDPDGNIIVSNVYISGNLSLNPEISAKPNGESHILWESRNPGIHYLFYNKYDISGSPLCGSPLTLSNFDIIDTEKFPAIAAGEFGDAYCIWRDAYNWSYYIYYAGIADNCGLGFRNAWYSHNNATHPDICVGGGFAWLVFELNGRIYDLLGNNNACAVTSSGGNARYPANATDGTAQYVAWYDDRDGNEEIYYAKIYGCDNLSGDVRITDDPGSSRMPDISMVGLDSFFVAWQDDRPGSYQIFLAKSFETPSIASFLVLDGNPVVPEPIGNWECRIYRVDEDANETFLGTLVTDENGIIIPEPAWFEFDDRVKIEVVAHRLHSNRDHHDMVGGTAHRIFLDNAVVQSEGPLHYGDYYSGTAEQPIILNHATIKYNLTVGIEWDATDDQFNNLEIAIRRLANYLYDVTDGQATLDSVFMFDLGCGRCQNSDLFGAADVQILDINTLPRVAEASLGYMGYWENDEYRCDAGIVRLPRAIYADNVLDQVVLSSINGVDWTIRTTVLRHIYHDPGLQGFAHELGHYLAYLGEEYMGGNCNGDFPGEYDFGLMDRPLRNDENEPMYGEMSSERDYDEAGSTNTDHWCPREMSCWRFLESIYEGESWDGREPCWEEASLPYVNILTPTEREGLEGPFLGPNNDIMEPDVDWGLVATILFENEGVGSQNIVWKFLDFMSPFPIDVRILRLAGGVSHQGLGSPEGSIYLVGINVGDVAMATQLSYEPFDHQLKYRFALEPITGLILQDTLETELIDIIPNQPLSIRPIATSPGEIQLVCDFLDPFIDLPQMQLIGYDDFDYSEQLSINDSSYISSPRIISGTSGDILIMAVDDSSQSFSIPLEYQWNVAESGQFVRLAHSFDFGCSLVLDDDLSQSTAVLVSGYRYLIPTRGLPPRAQIVSFSYCLSAYPNNGILPGTNYLSIAYYLPDSANTSLGDINLYNWDPDARMWDQVPGTIDTSAGIYDAQIYQDGLYALAGITAAICAYNPGDCNHNGSPLELADVITMIGMYRGTIEPAFTCDCSPHGIEFVPDADPNGNCVAFELGDVVTEIGAYRGTAEASGCPDCPGSLILFSGDGERLPVISPLRPKVKGKENFLRE